MRICPVALALLVTFPAHADDAMLPPAVRQMLETAIENGNEAEIAAVAKVARQTNPGSADEIQLMVNGWKEQVKQTREATIRDAGFAELWTGRIEAGGFNSTGSTSEIGISASAKLTRAGIQWSHKISANADYRRANGVVSRERYFASYEPRYQFDSRGFLYGLMQFERDTSIGYDERYTGSAGIGYKLITSTPLDLTIDAGPSIRYAHYAIGPKETRVGGRASLDMLWRISRPLTLRQTASSYAESGNYTFNSLTALETKVSSRWSAAISYNVQYESKTLLRARDLDTLSRVTLSYDF
ncbi:MAG: YdiY family protein [Sphingobium sp.]